MKQILLFLVLLLVGTPVFGATLDDAEVQDLLFMREEEKVARDVYLTMRDRYKMRVFKNIARSEQNHMNAMKKMLDRYDIEDPVKPAIGQFTNPELQHLYDELVARGKTSKIEALHVGAYIEEVDIIDIYAAISRTDEPRLKKVYTRLVNGSKSHLKAFVRNLKKAGVTYTPVVLSQAEYNKIVGY